MRTITPDLVLQHADQVVGVHPSEGRAAELAAALSVLVSATDEAATGLPLEAEPAHFLLAIDATVEG